MNELLERVKAATGPDRELDAVIHCQFTDTKYPQKNGDVRLLFGWTEANRPCFRYEPSPRYTASIDAALALVERLKPGKSRNILIDAVQEMLGVPDFVKRLPRVILAALLTALQDKQ